MLSVWLITLALVAAGAIAAPFIHRIDWRR